MSDTYTLKNGDLSLVKLEGGSKAIRLRPNSLDNIMFAWSKKFNKDVSDIKKDTKDTIVDKKEDKSNIVSIFDSNVVVQNPDSKYDSFGCKPIKLKAPMFEAAINNSLSIYFDGGKLVEVSKPEEVESVEPVVRSDDKKRKEDIKSENATSKSSKINKNPDLKVNVKKYDSDARKAREEEVFNLQLDFYRDYFSKLGVSQRAEEEKEFQEFLKGITEHFNKLGLDRAADRDFQKKLDDTREYFRKLAGDKISENEFDKRVEDTKEYFAKLAKNRNLEKARNNEIANVKNYFTKLGRKDYEAFISNKKLDDEINYYKDYFSKLGKSDRIKAQKEFDEYLEKVRNHFNELGKQNHISYNSVDVTKNSGAYMTLKDRINKLKGMNENKMKIHNQYDSLKRDNAEKRNRVNNSILSMLSDIENIDSEIRDGENTLNSYVEMQDEITSMMSNTR